MESASIKDLLAQAKGRGVSVPTRGWIMFQGWRALLFASWPFPPAVIRSLVPPVFEIDQYEGEAWVTLIPLGMRHLHLRYLPPIPGTGNFGEVNLRTYVTYEGRPGVYLFSIDAQTRLGVWLASTFFFIPCVYSNIELERSGETFRATSQRTASSKFPAAELEVGYGFDGPGRHAVRGSLEHFLVERYAMFSTDDRGRPYAGVIYHEPWTVHPATAEFAINTLLGAAAIPQPRGEPHTLYSAGLDTLAWPLRRLAG